MSGREITLSAIAENVGRVAAGDVTLHPGFMILNPTGNAPRVRHPTLPEAQRELKRLAEANPGHDFYILAPVLHARAEPPRASVRLAPEPPKARTAFAFEDDREIPF